MIYFDNAATTLIKPQNVFIKNAEIITKAGNPGRSGHYASMLSSNEMFKTREKLCEFFNIDTPENVIFTYNATYALNIAIKGFISKKCTVLTSGYEHNSVIRPLKSLGNLGVVTKIITNDLYDSEQFVVNFKNSIDNDTKFAVINHISNVFGYILPIKEIDEICFDHNIKLILDVSQSAGIVDINLQDFKSVVAICMPAHKSLYGVQGLGVAIFTQTPYKTIIEGGTGSVSNSFFNPLFLPDMLESGTPNVPAISSLYEGISYVQKNSNIQNKVFSLAKYFAKEMMKIPNTVTFFYDDINLQSGVVSFYNKRYDNEDLAAIFSKNDVALRAGLHCSPLAHKTVGTNGSIRASFSSLNTFEEIDEFLEIYKKITK